MKASPPRSTSFPSSLDDGIPPPTELREDAELSTHEELPTSPSYGEDGFGGYSAGFGSGDPWGGGGFSVAKDEWEEGHSRSPSGFVGHRGSDEGEGDWGGTRLERTVSVPVRSADEDDWEEAQKRIRLKQERAVGLRFMCTYNG